MQNSSDPAAGRKNTEEELRGTFTVVSRFIRDIRGDFTNGPVEFDNLLDAMGAQMGFLVGAPAAMAKAMLKEADIKAAKANILRDGCDRIFNDEEEAWIHYTPAKEEDAGREHAGNSEAAAAADPGKSV